VERQSDAYWLTAPKTLFARIGASLAEIEDKDETVRHREWLRQISAGTFSFRDRVAYVEKGEGSWKQKALNTHEDIADNRSAPLPYPALSPAHTVKYCLTSPSFNSAIAPIATARPLSTIQNCRATQRANGSFCSTRSTVIPCS